MKNYNYGNFREKNNKGSCDFTRIDAVYLRLKTLNIAYNVPKNITNSLGIDNVQLYLAGNNVFTIDNLGVWSGNYDPEITGSHQERYPTTKSWTTGLKINF